MRRARLLARHFVARILDNDLVSPHADAHQGAALGLACLLSASTFIATRAEPFVKSVMGVVAAQVASVRSSRTIHSPVVLVPLLANVAYRLALVLE